MKIERIRIDGFGHFEKLDLPLGPGLNCLYGPNEAGKSTLLAFIRAVLFGFEKRASPARYEPAHGAFGGELHLSTRLGPLVVRRAGSKRRFEGELGVRAPDGAPLAESRLDDALAGVPRELYYQVFAFGLSELSSFEALAEQGSVSEALFTAGMQGAQRLPEALDTLRRASEALYVPRGSKPELNALLGELSSVQANLKEAGDRPAEYLQLSARLTALEEEVRQADRAAEVASKALAEAKRLERAAPELARLSEVEAELAALPPLGDFPQGARARLEELLARAARARQERDAVAAELAGVGASLERLCAPTPIEAHAVAARVALEGFRARQDKRRALPARAAALAERRRQVAEALSGLGLSFSPEELVAADFGAAARGALATFKEQLAEVSRALRDREEGLRAAEAERERARAALRRVEAELSRLPELEPTALERRRLALARVEPLRAELERIGDGRRERRSMLEALKAQVEVPPKEAFPGWLGAAVAAGLVALALLAFALAGGRAGALALAAAGLLAGALWAVQRRAAAGFRAQAEAHGKREAWRRGEVSRLSAELAALEGEDRARREALEVAAREAGVEPGAGAGELAALAQELGRAVEAAHERARLSEELEAQRLELEGCEAAEARARDGREEAVARRDALARELSAWLAARRLPDGLSAERALELWTEAAAVRQRLLDVEAEARALEADREDCAAVADALVSVAGQALGASMEPEGAASALAAALQELEARGRDRRGLTERRAVLASQLARGEAALSEASDAAGRLLEQAGCADAEALLRKDAQAARFAELSRQARELRARVEAGARVPAPEARERLAAAGGVEELASRRARLEGEVASLTERSRALAEERGRLRARQEELEHDLSVQGLRSAEEELRARAAGLSARYAVDRLALALLEYARQAHEQQHQPRLIQLASRAFEAFTGGRYTRVHAPLGEDRALKVRDAQGREWDAEQLSRGTREQLYLSFRLAVIQDFGEARAPLPVIVDDILVNFDPERSRNAVRALRRLAPTHQVLAFTCHPHMRALFEEEGAALLELPRSAQAQGQMQLA